MPAPSKAGAGIIASEPNGENSSSEAEKDPHRPPCNDASCRKIRALLKTHYCDESPAGNGPDDSCDLRGRNKRSPDVKVIADYDCEWNEIKNEAECKQTGQVTPELRAILAHDLRRQGVPDKASGDTYFTVWESERARWSLARRTTHTGWNLISKSAM
jgi:hypothetical protein